MDGEELVGTIAMRASYMSDGSVVIKCDCSVEFKFAGGDEFDRIVRPQLFADTLEAHIRATHMPALSSEEKGWARTIVDLVMESLKRKAKE